MDEKQTRFLASVPQKVDNAIHRINHYPADEHWQNQLGYPVDFDLNVDSAIHPSNNWGLESSEAGSKCCSGKYKKVNKICCQRL